MPSPSNGTKDASTAQETVAAEWLQALLLGTKQVNSPQLSKFLKDAIQSDSCSWTKSLGQLVDRLARLQQLEGDFDAAVQHEKLESMRELAYGASHEINNPLANISSRAQTLLLDETDPDRRRKLETINAQAFRAHEMIADMMLFAKPPDLVRQRINLSDVVTEVVGELSDWAIEQETTIVVEATERDIWTEADPTYLATALKTLCRNSLEAIGSGGQITISLAEKKDTVELSVTDTGPGIPEEVRHHMFDPFYSGREAGRGLGFGLSKCWRIVDLHCGQIEVMGSDTHLTCFVIRLPQSNEKSLVA